MYCVDVNVMVDAHRPEQPRHDRVRLWLDAARRGHEPLGIPGIAASGFIRIVTHPRIFADPTPTAIAVDFIESLMRSPATVLIEPAERHFGIFTDLCRELDRRGNTVPDAYLAALAIEQSASFVTSDGGFHEYPGLRVISPTTS